MKHDFAIQLASYEAELGISMIDLLDESSDTTRLQDVLPTHPRPISTLFADLRADRHSPTAATPDPTTDDKLVDNARAESDAQSSPQHQVVESEVNPESGYDYEQRLYRRWKIEAGIR